MNKHILQFLLLTGLLYFTACSSSDNTTTELEETFPEKTPEEHKSSLEKAGLDYVDQMETLRNSSSINSISTLVDFLNNSDPFSNSEQQLGSPFRILHDLKAFQEDKISLKELANRRTKESEEPESIQELFDEIKGTYEWNSSEEDWDFTEGGDVATFKFPSEEIGTTNNAIFTIQKYAGVNIAENPLNESGDYTGDLPTEVLVDLTLDNTKIMEFSFNTSYSDNGTPTSMNTAITLDPFTLSYNFTNSTTEVKTGYSLTENSNNILSSEVAVQGNFDIDNIESSAEEEKVAGIVTSGSSTVQLFDIKFEMGVTDVASLETELNAIEDDQENDNYEVAADKLEAAMNNYLDLKVKYESTNEVIALGSAEGVVREETYYYYEWNPDTQNYDEKEGIDKWIEPELILEFGDGSKVSVETYFEEGFEELSTAVEDLLEDLGLEDDEEEVEIF